MYILFIDDWFLCIFIASVVQWCALCLTHWRPRLNFWGKRNIFNIKRNAIRSIALPYIISEITILKISLGSAESCELTPWRQGFKSGWCPLLEVSYFYFHALMRNYKVKYNHCDDFIRCLDGALISSEVNTLNSSGSDSRKIVDRGTTVVFYWSTWKKHEG